MKLYSFLINPLTVKDLALHWVIFLIYLFGVATVFFVVLLAKYTYGRVFTESMNKKLCFIFGFAYMKYSIFVTMYEITKLVKHKQKKKRNESRRINMKLSDENVVNLEWVNIYWFELATEPNSETSWSEQLQVIRVYIN